ncbi:4-hydroxybenzoate 3-monooxygenase [Micrococcus yunnanensis]|uniref:4-hydroxybenzoate 3-monooxygenase n=1 Tax=Micrococcus yunnanensis TaxID=566027 RepID=UPI003C2CBF4F
MTQPPVTRTRVGIVGGGPAGLTLSHLLARQGIDNVVLESRDPETIAHTHRAGILEQPSVEMLTDMGVDGRVRTVGDEHRGIILRFDGESHALDFPELVGATVTLYAQNEVFVDLAAARRRDGGDVRFEAEVLEVLDVDSDTPGVRFRSVAAGEEGPVEELRCDILVGADGSRSTVRKALQRDTEGEDHFHAYPFAWFGILAEAPKSSPELIYARSEHGFGLISQRSETVQRMYFQCDPSTRVEDWSDDRIWDRLQRIVAGPDGFTLKTGPIIDKTVLGFRSYVRTPLSHRNVFLAGDAGHTVPPTGAKGLNLAFADVRVLAEALESWAATGSRDLLDAYSETALTRVWKDQNFSYWMTTMLHARPDASEFEDMRVRGELRNVVQSRYGRQFLAEQYTGWPSA